MMNILSPPEPNIDPPNIPDEIEVEDEVIAVKCPGCRHSVIPYDRIISGVHWLECPTAMNYLMRIFMNNALGIYILAGIIALFWIALFVAIFVIDWWNRRKSVISKPWNEFFPK